MFPTLHFWDVMLTLRMFCLTNCKRKECFALQTAKKILVYSGTLKIILIRAVLYMSCQKISSVNACHFWLCNLIGFYFLCHDQKTKQNQNKNMWVFFFSKLTIKKNMRVYPASMTELKGGEISTGNVRFICI